jgi:hypothetical protein
MREIDPFSYYPDRASAIAGFGGNDRGPDPRYCFHTSYINVRPGEASFQLQLRGGRATYGRLSLRVHALRPGSDENASFVAGARVDVAVNDMPDLCVSVSFAALRHTQYAFYGQFVKDTDIQADAVAVFLVEGAGQEGDYIEPPRSVLALTQGEQGARSDNALFHVLGHHLLTPVSQDCTTTQLAELEREGWPGQGKDGWAEALCLNALRTYEVTQPGLEGLVVGHCSEYFSETLTQAGFFLRQLPADPPPPDRSGIFADFLVWPEGLWAEENADRRWDVINGWFARLKIGGVGIVTCRFNPGNRRAEKQPVLDGPQITVGEIEKWAVRLIALGYAVAPLAFSAPEVQQADEDGLVRFALVARRI